MKTDAKIVADAIKIWATDPFLPPRVREAFKSIVEEIHKDLEKRKTSQ